MARQSRHYQQFVNSKGANFNDATTTRTSVHT